MKCNKKKTNEGETVKDIKMSHNNSLLVCAKKQPVHFQFVATAMISLPSETKCCNCCDNGPLLETEKSPKYSWLFYDMHIVNLTDIFWESKFSICLMRVSILSTWYCLTDSSSQH